MRTQVGIIGAGPAGLMLARLLHLQGIESIIIENRDRPYIETRLRAGLIEHWAADLITEVGAGERMKREGMPHWGVNINVNGDIHRIDFKKLVDKRLTIYGQQEVVKDMVAQRLAHGGALLFEVDGVSVHDLTSERPTIKFTHEGGVAVQVRADAQGAVVEVVDTGIGIAARDQSRIFEPFEQVDASNSRRYPGTGLGLSIVQRIVDEHGGTVAALNGDEGGAVVVVRLPVYGPSE